MSAQLHCNKSRKTWVVSSAFLASLLLAGCSQSSSPLETSTSAPLPASNPVATGVPEVGRINKKGGTKIAVLVNDTPITNSAINRRMAFVRLRRMKGNARTIATNELIDEAIKMREARRIRAVVDDKAVDAAFGRFARNNKMTPSILRRVLNQRGVSTREFKNFIRVSMSWQRAVGARLNAEANGRVAQPGRRNTGPKWLPPIGQKTTDVKEYTIQQVVFIVPQNRRAKLLGVRKGEARRFRAAYRGCESGQEQAKGLRDVTVIDRGRLLATKLPSRWKKDIVDTAPGKMTKPKETQRGVEMLAVCKTREVRAVAQPTNEIFSGGNFAKAASALEKKYIAELKGRAKIVRR